MVSFMWNLKNKWATTTKKNWSHRYREQKGVARGEEERNRWGRQERNRWGRFRGTNFQLQNKCQGNQVFSMHSIITNYVISLNGDRW